MTLQNNSMPVILNHMLSTKCTHLDGELDVSKDWGTTKLSAIQDSVIVMQAMRRQQIVKGVIVALLGVTVVGVLAKYLLSGIYYSYNRLVMLLSMDVICLH